MSGGVSEPEKPVWGPVADEAVLLISGSDAVSWLQGQITNDARLLETGNPLSFCFCRPTGQVEAIARAVKTSIGILMTVPKRAVDTVLARFAEFVVMEDVGVELTDQAVFTVQGAESLPSEGGTVMKSRRSPSGGFDLIGPGEIAEQLEALYGPANIEKLEELRVLSGTPRFGVDADSSVMPPELGPILDSEFVSYAKGCYTGQEVLMRIRSRGHTNRVWTLLACKQPVSAGSEIFAGDKSVGKVTSALSEGEFGPVAAAFVRNDALDGPLKAVLNGATVSCRNIGFKDQR